MNVLSYTVVSVLFVRSDEGCQVVLPYVSSLSWWACEPTLSHMITRGGWGFMLTHIITIGMWSYHVMKIHMVTRGPWGHTAALIITIGSWETVVMSRLWGCELAATVTHSRHFVWVLWCWQLHLQLLTLRQLMCFMFPTCCFLERYPCFLLLLLCLCRFSAEDIWIFMSILKIDSYSTIGVNFLQNTCLHSSHYNSMTLCKTAVTPLLKYWSYCSLAQSHRILAPWCKHDRLSLVSSKCDLWFHLCDY